MIAWVLFQSGLTCTWWYAIIQCYDYNVQSWIEIHREQTAKILEILRADRVSNSHLQIVQLNHKNSHLSGVGPLEHPSASVPFKIHDEIIGQANICLDFTQTNDELPLCPASGSWLVIRWTDHQWQCLRLTQCQASSIWPSSVDLEGHSADQQPCWKCPHTVDCIRPRIPVWPFPSCWWWVVQQHRFSYLEFDVPNFSRGSLSAPCSVECIADIRRDKLASTSHQQSVKSSCFGFWSLWWNIDGLAIRSLQRPTNDSLVPVEETFNVLGIAFDALFHLRIDLCFEFAAQAHSRTFARIKSNF